MLDTSNLPPDVIDISQVCPDVSTFEGSKMKVSDLLDIPILITNWFISKSKFKVGPGGSTDQVECLHLQILLNDVPHVVFSGSKVLIGQMKAITQFLSTHPEYPKMKIAAVIRRRNGKYYKLESTKSFV